MTLRSQLVQGDPGQGNFLFAAGQAAGIIDVSPYWHPPSYSLAMLVADGVAWSAAQCNCSTKLRP